MGLATAIGAVLTAFFTAIIALVALRELWFSTTPKDKLVSSGVVVKQFTMNNQLFPEITIGFELRNIATFSIELEIVGMATEVKNLHPSLARPVGEKFRIFPGNSFWLWDNYIDLINIPRQSETLRGRIYAKLKYGRLGKLDQELELKNNVSITFDKSGNLLTWEGSEIS